MSFMEEQRSQGAVDERFQAFIETEANKQQLQKLMLNITDICWEVCVDIPSSRLSPKIEQCFINCVDRFFDVANFMTNRVKRLILNHYQK
ncbi:mitochondrial import inner membrane translocase subunit Tim8 A-like [Ptiloglossa arizonensis]|uniref:mitochondrial import inner membrane translocase subunit Tim8 A-like n=1 Tax=Ptiloglossa arizonensis TaxID=3350558 RepID=UPI003FA11BEF